MPILVIKSGSGAGRRFEFDRDIEVGRGSTAGISLDHPTISRRHAAFSLSEKRCLVQDLHSQNGTTVNGRVIHQPTPIHDGDELRIGGIRFDFCWEQDPVRRGAAVVTLIDSGPGVVETQPASDPIATLVPGAGDAISRRLRLIYEVGLTICQTLDEDQMLSLLLEKLFEIFPKAERGFLMLYEAGKEDLTPAAVRTRSSESSEITISRTLVWDVLRNRRGVLSVDALSDERFRLSKSIHLMGVRSVLCVPMIARDTVYGIIALDSTAAAGFEKDDITLLLGIGTQSALSLANARLHQRLLAQELLDQDLALARRIQGRFLPKSPPDIQGYDFRAYYLSALEVGGDYYDFLVLDGNQIGIALGDVSGKGVSAALYMARFSSEVRYCSAGEESPAEILRRVNASVVSERGDGMFVTSLFLALEPSTGRLRVASAGHMPPLLRRADGSIVELSTPRNMPLGVQDSATFEQSEFRLQAHDTVLVYTDGISEAVDTEDRLFGEARLRTAMKDSDASPAGVMTGVLSAVETFVGGRPQNDDITLLCFGPVSQRPVRETLTRSLAAVGVTGFRKPHPS